jgi:type IV secretion system protein VirD4
LTPGEVMQLPPTDELVLVSGIPPIRAKKARYYEDAQLKNRVLPPPALTAAHAGTSGDRSVLQADDWTSHPIVDPCEAAADGSAAGSLVKKDAANGGVRREPTLPGHEAIAPEIPKAVLEFGPPDDDGDDEVDDEAIRAKKMMNQSFHGVARQAVLDPDDDLGL